MKGKNDIPSRSLPLLPFTRQKHGLPFLNQLYFCSDVPFRDLFPIARKWSAAHSAGLADALRIIRTAPLHDFLMSAPDKHGLFSSFHSFRNLWKSPSSSGQLFRQRLPFLFFSLFTRMCGCQAFLKPVHQERGTIKCETHLAVFFAPPFNSLLSGECPLCFFADAHKETEQEMARPLRFPDAGQPPEQKETNALFHNARALCQK